jgi:hypothetical protein
MAYENLLEARADWAFVPNNAPEFAKDYIKEYRRAALEKRSMSAAFLATHTGGAEKRSAALDFGRSLFRAGRPAKQPLSIEDKFVLEFGREPRKFPPLPLIQRTRQASPTETLEQMGERFRRELEQQRVVDMFNDMTVGGNRNIEDAFRAMRARDEEEDPDDPDDDDYLDDLACLTSDDHEACAAKHYRCYRSLTYRSLTDDNRQSSYRHLVAQEAHLVAAADMTPLNCGRASLACRAANKGN